jgi:hypothetical protein
MVGDSLWVTLVSSTTKTGRHDIAKILLKVALNTLTLTPKHRKEIRHFRIDTYFEPWITAVTLVHTRIPELGARFELIMLEVT